ncbi:MAG: hypothetical protein AAF605_03050 [Myxococcota bacterium]
MKNLCCGFCCATALALAGCGEGHDGVELTAANLETQAAADSWPRTGMVGYDNTEFKVTLNTVEATAPDVANEVHWQNGALESFVLYPYCSARFYKGNDNFSKSYNSNQDNNPYYVSDPDKSKREKWGHVRVYCKSSVPVEDAMLWSDAGQQGQKIPLFRIEDLDFGYWFANNASSIDVGYGRYVILYKDGEKHSTAIGRADFSWLGNDNKLSRTEVRLFSPAAGEVGCNEPRTCYKDSAACALHSDDNTDLSNQDQGDLEACSSDGGLSYCTGQGYCVLADSGEPVIYSGVVDDH